MPRKINCKHFKNKPFVACKNSKACHGEMCSLKEKYDPSKAVK